MSIIQGFLYTWRPSAGACAQCLTRPTISVKKPPRPHDHCKCKIEKEPLTLKKLIEYKRVLTNSQTHEERIAIVTPGNCLEIEHTVSASSTNSWEINGGLGLGGLSIGGSTSNESTNEESITVKQKFCHGGVCVNKTEYVYTTYRTNTYTIFKKYSIKTLALGQTMTMTDISYEYDMTHIDTQTRCE